MKLQPPLKVTARPEYRSCAPGGGAKLDEFIAKLPDLIDAGVDVLHPVQKQTMDEKATVESFGGKISFLCGIDVQHVLQEADADGVREEVRFLIDTFDRPEGRMCIAAGNGIVADTPMENIDAFLDEAIAYGSEHRKTVTTA